MSVGLCGCTRGFEPCGHLITQEDMLCDGCRRGDCNWSSVRDTPRYELEHPPSDAELARARDITKFLNREAPF